jgi:hypothetical protein
MAAGVYLSAATDPLPLTLVTKLFEYMYLYTYSHREGGGVDEPVRRLAGR